MLAHKITTNSLPDLISPTTNSLISQHLHHSQHHFLPMRLSQHQMCAIFSVFTMCQRQILAVIAGTGDNQALDNRNSGENTIGIDVDAPAVTASPSTENNEPSLIARTHGEDSSSDLKRSSNSRGSSNSKGGSKNGDETSSGNKSKEDKAKKEKMAKIQKRAKQIEEDNKRRHEAAKAKGFVYQSYDSNDINEV
ncbi:hypothetical protein B0O99DRAFT_615438 [Bisporella sp. PMI_857]|nr:hypothetical protein B0O99DRAFT_615438 [Bisporella sp. PMI_857]